MIGALTSFMKTGSICLPYSWPRFASLLCDEYIMAVNMYSQRKTFLVGTTLIHSREEKGEGQCLEGQGGLAFRENTGQLFCTGSKRKWDQAPA